MAFPVHLDGNLDRKNDEEENCRNDVNETCQTPAGKYLPNFAATKKENDSQQTPSLVLHAVSQFHISSNICFRQFN